MHFRSNPIPRRKWFVTNSSPKAKKILGKFLNSSLSQCDKLVAISSVIEPSLIYPLVNIFFSEKDIRPLDSITYQMKCISLGLKHHFPRALLHGPTQLGGIQIPSKSQKNSKDRLKYFLYNIKDNSYITLKLEMSIIYNQIEIGHFNQFFTLPVSSTGHLVSDSFCVQLWKELEPKGLILQPSSNTTWTPTQLHDCDITLNSLAIRHYDTRESAIINHCRMHLHLISTYDMLIFQSKTIHPEYLIGIHPISRTSHITWPPFPCPPKNY
jgi:hypothetical protein